MDTLFRFEFDEAFHINSICIRARSFHGALHELCLMLGDSILHYVVSLHKIN